MRVAWITPVAPPTPSGQSRVLGALLDKGIAEDSIILTNDASALAGRDQVCDYVPLSVRKNYRAVAIPGVGPWLQRFDDWACVHARARTIERNLRQRPVDIVVGCTADRALLPAAWLSARRLGFPFVAYLFDDPVYQWPDSGHRRAARGWERRWSATAAAIITPNEVLAADISARCGVPCVLLRNCISPAAFAGEPTIWPTKAGEISIVYTGAVYHAHYDAFVNLIRAIPNLSVPAVLHVYTDQDEASLRRLGIDGPVVYHRHLPAAEIHRVQQQADILFLPMAFNSSIPEVIRSSAPGKMGEYLASGRPVLVHAPADSFVATFHASRGCGFVVDVLSPEAVAGRIEEIIDNAPLRESTVGNARTAAAAEFSPDTVRRNFRRILESIAVKSSSDGMR